MSKIKTECIDIFEKEEENKLVRNCSVCGKEQVYKTISSFNRAVREKRTCQKCAFKIRKLNTKKRKENEIWSRDCPNCDSIIIYSDKYKLLRAEENNSYCIECRDKIKFNLAIKRIKKEKNKLYQKKCPTCGETQSYSNADSLKSAIKKNCDCSKCQHKKSKLTEEEKKESKKRKKEWQKKYWQKNKHNPEKRKKRRENSRKRNKDPMKRLNGNISAYIRMYLKSNNLSKNGIHWENLVINGFQEIMEHLEKNFLTGMTWKNYGKKWHIDHIIPTSFFKFSSTDDVEFKYCWSINNLQPLWKKDNLEKRDEITFWGKKIKARNLYKKGTSELKVIPTIPNL